MDKEFIEEQTLIHYKKLTNWVKLMKLYDAQKNSDEESYDPILEIDQSYLPFDKIGKIEGQRNIETSIKDLKLQINLEFENLYKFAEKNNFFWCYSPFETYFTYYEDFFTNYRQITSDGDRFSFLKNEIQYYLDFQDGDESFETKHKSVFIHKTDLTDHFVYVNFYEYLFESNKVKLKNQKDKILDFLVEKCNELGFKVKFRDGQFTMKKVQNINSEIIDREDEEVLNISNLPDFSLAERLILFDKLGFLNIIESVDTNSKNKNTIGALILNCSPSSFKKHRGGYLVKGKTKEETEEKTLDYNDNVEDFLRRNKINLK
ncbi:hypothetical protein [Polaribacter sp. OB-PA-B3]